MNDVMKDGLDSGSVLKFYNYVHFYIHTHIYTLDENCSRYEVEQFTYELSLIILFLFLYFYLVCEAIGTAATPGLLCQPRVIVKMIVEKQMECRPYRVLTMVCNTH
jgi:hypothetical protein